MKLKSHNDATGRTRDVGIPGKAVSFMDQVSKRQMVLMPVMRRMEIAPGEEDWNTVAHLTGTNDETLAVVRNLVEAVAYGRLRERRPVTVIPTEAARRDEVVHILRELIVPYDEPPPEQEA